MNYTEWALWKHFYCTGLSTTGSNILLKFRVLKKLFLPLCFWAFSLYDTVATMLQVLAHCSVFIYHPEVFSSDTVNNSRWGVSQRLWAIFHQVFPFKSSLKCVRVSLCSSLQRPLRSSVPLVLDISTQLQPKSSTRGSSSSWATTGLSWLTTAMTTTKVLQIILFWKEGHETHLYQDAATNDTKQYLMFLKEETIKRSCCK